MEVIIPIVAGIVGVVLGSALTRRNERRAHADRLLAEALNDLVKSIAEVAGGDHEAQSRYAGATSRIALHGSPELVKALHVFQQRAETGSDDGRARLLSVVAIGRRQLGAKAADEEAMAVLLFGTGGPYNAPALDNLF